MEMRLLLIFALSFTLSAKQDNKNNADEESTESGNAMMNKALDALSEKHTMEILNALNNNDIEKLTDCAEDGECKMADFVDLLEKILYFFKETSHDDKPIYDLIKALIKHGPLAELVNELSEKHILEIIDALTLKEIGKLMNIGKRPINIFVLISIGEKIVPIIKKANSGKGVSKLIRIFTAGGDGNMENSNQKLEKIMNALSEEHTMKIINALNAQEVEKLTDCLEGECSMADSVKILEKILDILKGLSHGDKLIYNLIKEHFKHGPLAELVNELSEEYTLRIINVLNGKDIDKLMNIGKEIYLSEIISIGKKIKPIIKKAKDDKGVSKLMSIFSDDEDGETDLSYYQLVPGGLHPGMSVYIQGTMAGHSNRTWVNFQVDFTCGQHKEADVPLHFRSHINAKSVGLNTFQAGRWGKEEKYMTLFPKSEQIEVMLIVHDFGYQVLINRNDICNYHHRIPPQNVRVIRIDGDLELQSLSVMGGPMMAIPYHHHISGGLRPGMSIYVKGTMPQKGDSFRVDFACGQDKGDKIPFHFRPYINAKRVGLNTFNGNKWVKEVVHNMVFQRGQDFEFIFMVNEAGYEVLVNKKPFCSYSHLVPPETVQVINVMVFGANTDLKLKSLIVIGGPMMGDMAIPYHHHISGGLRPWMSIYVKGTMPQKGDSFWVDFACGQNNRDKIPFRFRPYFNRKTIGLNTFNDNKWGEEVVHNMVFQRGQDFEFIFTVNEAGYEVLVNKKPFCSYRHLFPPETVRMISVMVFDTKTDLELKSLFVVRPLKVMDMVIPYHHHISGGLRPWMSIYVKGTMPQKGDSFWVDFACGQDKRDKIPFRFRPYFNRKTIGLNTFNGNKWGEEVFHNMVFQRGQDFEFIFTVHEAGYEVLVNKKPFCSYRHLFPPETVRVISVMVFDAKTDLELKSLIVTGEPMVGNVAIPYHHLISGGLHPGMSIYVKGTMPQKGDSFRVDFACGQNKRDKIPFHFRPYFNAKRVGINTFNGNKWLKEVFHNIVFQRGQDFEFIFTVNKAGYEVLVNKKPFCNYTHLLPPETVRVISVMVFDSRTDLKLKSLFMV